MPIQYYILQYIMHIPLLCDVDLELSFVVSISVILIQFTISVKKCNFYSVNREPYSKPTTLGL